MRLGVYLPFKDRAGQWLDAAQLAARARMYEEAGVDSAWIGDHLPLPGETGYDWPDPFLWLMVAAAATETLQLGTCVFCVPLRTPYDVVQRLYTLERLAPDRFTIGVGTGSQEREYEANGLDWQERFGRMRDHMRTIRGAEVDIPALVLGSWFSEPQIRRAAGEYDGWMASASPGTRFGGWRKVLTEGIERYRSFGGERAMVVNVVTDLSVPTTPLSEDGFFSLRCDSGEAARRVQWLADLGYDEVVLRPTKPGTNLYDEADLTLEELMAIRALVPSN